MIEARGLTKRYGNTVAVDGITRARETSPVSVSSHSAVTCTRC